MKMLIVLSTKGEQKVENERTAQKEKPFGFIRTVFFVCYLLRAAKYAFALSAVILFKSSLGYLEAAPPLV